MPPNNQTKKKNQMKNSSEEGCQLFFMKCVLEEDCCSNTQIVLMCNSSICKLLPNYYWQILSLSWLLGFIQSVFHSYANDHTFTFTYHHTTVFIYIYSQIKLATSACKRYFSFQSKQTLMEIFSSIFFCIYPFINLLKSPFIFNTTLSFQSKSLFIMWLYL